MNVYVSSLGKDSNSEDKATSPKGDTNGSFPSNVTYYRANTVMTLYLFFISLRVDDEGNAGSNKMQEGD